MKAIQVICITLLGIIVGAYSYWRIPYNEINLFDFHLWLLVGAGSFIASLLSTLYLNKKPRLVALLIGLGVVLALTFRIMYDILSYDSTAHSLAPFELIFSSFQSLPMAIAGAYLAKFIQKLKNIYTP